jgi:branched-chain amino acid transport system ATP-binding protein
MLSVRGLETFYGVSQVLFGITLDVAQGEVVTLLGRNGMGKTTTINSIMGIVRARTGSSGSTARRSPACRPSASPSSDWVWCRRADRFSPTSPCYENLVATAANRHVSRSRGPAERIFEMFPELAARRSAMGNLLSGGEQQMLAIGRALMTNPRLLLLDEATEGLAPLIRQKIWAALASIRESGVSILVVDKNVADLIRLADRHVIIEKGRVVWQGTSPELAAQEDIQHRYLGV